MIKPKVKGYVQVLWVENDPKVLSSYPRRAEKFHIQLESCPTWEEAQQVLESDYGRWQAIILDAKCQVKAGDADLETRFLSNAIAHIMTLAHHNNRSIPWYVLSGEAASNIRDLIPESRLEWDGDWDNATNKPFYSKDEKFCDKYEREWLFDRIYHYVVRNEQEHQVRNDLYPEVFKAIESAGLPVDVENNMVDLLAPISFKGKSNKECNNCYQLLRKTTEMLFMSMIDNGVVPNCFRTGKGPNLSYISSFLGENPIKNPKVEKQIIRHKQFMPKPLTDFIKYIIFDAGGALHAEDEKSQLNEKNIDKYLQKVDGSSYLIKSLTLAMCDILIWYNKFLHNPEELQNAQTYWEPKTAI